MVFWTPERDNALKEMRADGYTTGQIADALRCTKNAVIGRARRKKFPTPNGPRGNALRADRLSPKLSPRPKSIKAKRIESTSTEPTPEAPKIDRSVAWEPLPGTTPVPLHEHKDGCRWPIGDPLHPGFGFCNEEISVGSPYCLLHRQMGTRRNENKEGVNSSVQVGKARGKWGKIGKSIAVEAGSISLAGEPRRHSLKPVLSHRSNFTAER